MHPYHRISNYHKLLSIPSAIQCALLLIAGRQSPALLPGVQGGTVVFSLPPLQYYMAILKTSASLEHLDPSTLSLYASIPVYQSRIYICITYTVHADFDIPKFIYIYFIYFYFILYNIPMVLYYFYLFSSLSIIYSYASFNYI